MGKNLKDFIRCGGMDLLMFLGVLATLIAVILLHPGADGQQSDPSTPGSPAILSAAGPAMHD